MPCRLCTEWTLDPDRLEVKSNSFHLLPIMVHYRLFPLLSSRTPAHRPPATGHRPRPPATGHRPPATATRHLPPAGHRTPATGHRSPESEHRGHGHRTPPPPPTPGSAIAVSVVVVLRSSRAAYTQQHLVYITATKVSTYGAI